MSKIPGRLHATGGVLFILCGIGHSIGQFSATPLDGTTSALERTMRASVIPGTSFTYWNVMQCWGALYGAMTILFGVLLLAAARASAGSAGVRLATGIVGVIAAVVQAACAIYFKTIPPAFFMIPAALLLLVASFWPEPRAA
jgi:hypothetical protein